MIGYAPENATGVVYSRFPPCELYRPQSSTQFVQLVSNTPTPSMTHFVVCLFARIHPPSILALVGISLAGGLGPDGGSGRGWGPFVTGHQSRARLYTQHWLPDGSPKVRTTHRPVCSLPSFDTVATQNTECPNTKYEKFTSLRNIFFQSSLQTVPQCLRCSRSFFMPPKALPRFRNTKKIPHTQLRPPTTITF